MQWSVEMIWHYQYLSENITDILEYQMQKKIQLTTLNFSSIMVIETKTYCYK